jgi:hypothetical protein
MLFDLELAITKFLWPTLLAAALVAALTIAVERRRGIGFLFLRVALSIAPAVAFFLRQGYLTNRFRFSGYWFGSVREFAGIVLPDALFRGDVWLANALITLIALVVGGTLWWLLGWFGAERASHLGSVAARPSWILAVVVLVLFPLAGARALRASAEERPSIILVSLDTLRADHLGIYGYERDTSPELDRLGEESMVFDWAISQAPNTSHSHMSIFTSSYPTVHGFRGEHDQLAGFWNTLPEYFREAGYRTAATTDGGLMRGWYGYQQGFERYQDDRLQGLARSVDRAFGWLDSGLADSPFFLFVHTYDVHTPYAPPKPFRGMFTDGSYAGDFHPGSQELESIRRRLDADPTQGHGLSEEDVAFIKARYDEEIRYADHVMGRFIAGLRSRGILDRTWLIITADHGEEFTEHGSVLHEKLYQTLIHVPLIIRPPGPADEGARIQEIVELIDIMPTMLELATIEAPDNLQGASLVELMKGNAVGWSNVGYSEQPWFGMRRSITVPRFHLLTSLETGEVELYDYHADPLEQTPLDGEEYENVRNCLLQRVLDWSKEQIASRTPDGTVPLALDEDALDELKALGYIQ